jgi:CAAX protease family protein
MVREMDRRNSLVPVVVYVVLFHLSWVGWVYFVYPRVKSLGEATLEYALVNLGIRLAVWVVPVFLFLRYVDRVDPCAYLKLKQRWKRGILVGLGFTVLNFSLLLARYGVPHPSVQAMTWNGLLGTSLLIGFVEEIPYRGFIFQKFQERLSFWPACFLSALLFLAIHLPGWFALHMLRAESVIFVFCFGVLMTVIFKYSRSLWAPIVAHSLNDFLSAIIFHL